MSYIDPDKDDEITRALDERAKAIRAYRAFRAMEKEIAMDRLREKFKQAGGVVGRQVARMEAKADELIAREKEHEALTDEKFAEPHAALDQSVKDMGILADMLKLVSNDPLGDTESTEQEDDK